MTPLRDLTEADLNQRTLQFRREWSLGMLEAANLVNEMYSNSTILGAEVERCGEWGESG